MLRLTLMPKQKNVTTTAQSQTVVPVALIKLLFLQRYFQLEDFPGCFFFTSPKDNMWLIEHSFDFEAWLSWTMFPANDTSAQ